MVNKVVLDYVRSNRGKFSMRDIRTKILSKGYPKADVEEAISVLGEERGVLSDRAVRLNKGGFKWIKMAGVIGLVFFALYLLNFVLGLLNINVLSSVPLGAIEYLNVGISFVAVVALCFFYYGFVRIGRLAGSGMLRISSIVFMVFSILLLLLFVMSSVFSIFNIPDVGQLISGSPIGGSFTGFVIFGIIFFAIIVFRYLFVVGLIRIRRQVSFSMVAGIVGLINAIFFTLILGFFVYLMIYPGVFVNFIINYGSSIPQLVERVGYIFTIFILADILFESLSLLSGSKKFE